MVFVMVSDNEVFCECAERICVDVWSRNNKKLGFVVLWDIRFLSVVDGGAIEGG
jgi:hypothetical protein